MKRARAGDRDKRILIEHLSEAQNTTYGGTDKSWVTFKSKWAMIKPYSRGMEQFDGAAVRAEKILVFQIQYDSTITTKMRINYKGVIYNIRSTSEPVGMRTILLDIFAEAEE